VKILLFLQKAQGVLLFLQKLIFAEGLLKKFRFSEEETFLKQHCLFPSEAPGFPAGNPAMPRTTIDFILFPFFRNFATSFRIFLFFFNDSPLPQENGSFFRKANLFRKHKVPSEKKRYLQGKFCYLKKK